MNIICTKDNLQKGINAVSRLVGKNVSLPILGHLLLETDNGRLKISGTNLELGAICWIGCQVKKEGKTTAAAHLLQGVVSGLSSNNVTLDATGEMLQIHDDSSRSELCILNSEDFPLIPRITGESLTTISSDQLNKALSRVVNACAQTESRPEISGVYIARREKEVVFAATDSYRLAEASFTSAGDSFSFILPQHTASELVRLSSEFPSDIEVFLSENQVFFKFHSFYLVSRLIDGQYPDYIQIVPKQFSAMMIVRRDDAIRSVKSAALFADRKTNDISVTCDPKKSQCVVFAVSSDSGKGKATIPALSAEGDEKEIIVNYRYMLDGLSNIPTENVIFELNSGTEPMLMRPEGTMNYYYILMPINT